MSVIKFRGKSIYTGRWVYGYVYNDHKYKGLCNKNIFIIRNEYESDFEVNNQTVCKYTGLKDKNGVEIYEGDIVKVFEHTFRIIYEIGSFMLSRESDETDMYDLFDNCWNDDVYPLSQLYWETDCEENKIYELEVIGNIHDNKGD